MNRKNFCYVPFRELYFEHNSGDTKPGYRSCCIQTQSHKGELFNKQNDWFKTDSELVKIREDFLQDRRPSNCSNCWNAEDKGLVSSRQHENKKYVNQWRNISPEDPPVLEIIDVRLTNKCNLQCKMCYSGNSDQIAKNIIAATEAGAIGQTAQSKEYWDSYQADFYKDFGNIDPVKGLFEFIMAHDTIKEIKFAGGESFLMPELEKLMLKLIDAGRTNLYIYFLTNCTTVKTSVLEILKKFDRTEIACSIDGPGKWIEYQRFPVKWETLKRNYRKLIEHNMDTSITPCWSHLNMLGMADFIKWVQSETVSQCISYNEVSTPSYLNWELIPLKYRTELINELDSMDLKSLDLDLDYISMSERLSSDVKQITEQERTELRNNVNLWDFNNDVKYRDMYPWAKELLGE